MKNGQLKVFFILSLFLWTCQEGREKLTPEGFEIHPSFKMELLASEPLVFDPVDMAFDEFGRAFVLEMPGYPDSQEASRIVLLQDQDKDGRFDKRIIVADDLGVASSFLPYRSGFLVAAPPDLVYLKDTDGDEVADHKEVILSGFEVGNLQHNYNGLSYGLDNWIYAANGGNNGKPYFTGQSDQALDLRGEDFRFRMESRQIERVGLSSGGFELAFDHWGNMFETHNLEHLSQLVFPGYYLDSLPIDQSDLLTIISDHEENGLARIYPVGEQETRVNHPEQSGYFSGACGIHFYGGKVFPDGFNDHIFVADVVLNLIHLDVLTSNKSIFKGSRMRPKKEFLASYDRSFRPVNMTTGPDGALYILDMHREVIEHPEWIPDEIEVDLNLAAGKDKGRIYRVTPRKNWKSIATVLDHQIPASLVEALNSPNQWTRLTAQRLIVAANDSVYYGLLAREIRESSNPLAILHALWSLEGLGYYSLELLEHGFRSSDPGLQVNAIKIAERHLKEDTNDLIPLILETGEKGSAWIARQAALCLGTVEYESYQLFKLEIGNFLFQLLERKDIDRWTAIAAATAVRYQAEKFMVDLLTSNYNEYQETVALILAQLIGQEKPEPAIESLLLSLSESSSLDAGQIARLVDALVEGWDNRLLDKARQKEILSAIIAVEQRGDAAIIRACAQLRRAMHLPVSDWYVQKITTALREVTNRNLRVEDRLEYLQLIEIEAFEKRAATLYSLLDNLEPLAIQKESLRQLWRANDPSTGPQLVRLWPQLGPDARKIAADILLYKTFNQEVLLSALEQGKIKVGEMNFDLERRRTLLWWTDNEEVKQRAKMLFSDAGVVTRKEAISKMRPALDLAGDMRRGKEQFIHRCSQCHRYGDLGKEVGPVLTEINRKSKATLLHEIIDPNAAVDAKYIQHQVSMKDGTIYNGIIDRETDESIVVLQMGGLEQRLAKKDIEKLSSRGTSMMPEGLEVDLSPQELADLLAFLQQENL